MTAGQLADFLKSGPSPVQASEPSAPRGKRYVYGLKGIQELFHCCSLTAQRYKNGVIAGAVRQYGRKIVVDADLALELFNAAKGR